jgi:hypothetical protein
MRKSGRHCTTEQPDILDSAREGSSCAVRRSLRFRFAAAATKVELNGGLHH